MTDANSQSWSPTQWRNFSIELPSTWEMLRFSRKLDVGRCAFADRYQVRLELSWRKVPCPPDRERMLSDYMTRLADEGWERLQRVREGSWDGIVGEQDGRPVSRFGHYFPALSCVLELVFLWPGERECGLERRVLKGVMELPPENGQQVWRAFGLHMRLPAELVLETCKQNAARAEFVFKAARAVDEFRFMRLGMVSTWLTQSVTAWSRRQAPKGVTVKDESVKTVSGHDVAYCAGRAKRWRRGLRLHRPYYESWAGLCPVDGRLYFVSSLARTPRRQSPLPCACSSGTPLRSSATRDSERMRPTPSRAEAESWVDMLGAVPMRNVAARFDDAANGTVVVHVPRNAARELRPPLSWIVPVHAERRIVLDGVGHYVWSLCTSSRTVEEIIVIFAHQHALSFHEARVSVTEYLKQLIQRGVLAIKMP